MEDVWAGHGTSCGYDYRLSPYLCACGRSHPAPRIGHSDGRSLATRLPSLWACVRGRSARSVTWSCGLVQSCADALEPRRMRPKLRTARPRALMVVKTVVHGPPVMLPAFAGTQGWPAKQDHPAYIPRILRPVRGSYPGVSEPGKLAIDEPQSVRPVTTTTPLPPYGRSSALVRSWSV